MKTNPDRISGTKFASSEDIIGLTIMSTLYQLTENILQQSNDKHDGNITN
jgi:hypothetical protein